VISRRASSNLLANHKVINEALGILRSIADVSWGQDKAGRSGFWPCEEDKYISAARNKGEWGRQGQATWSKRQQKRPQFIRFTDDMQVMGYGTSREDRAVGYFGRRSTEGKRFGTSGVMFDTACQDRRRRIAFRDGYLSTEVVRHALLWMDSRRSINREARFDGKPISGYPPGDMQATQKPPLVLNLPLRH